jgi:hypothetical protein
VVARRNRLRGSGLGEFRWFVERSFAWLHCLGRLRRCLDRRTEIQEAFLHLKVLLKHLSGTDEEQFFDSYQVMYDARWRRCVTNAHGPPGREEFLSKHGAALGPCGGALAAPGAAPGSSAPDRVPPRARAPDHGRTELELFASPELLPPPVRKHFSVPPLPGRAVK